MQLTTSCAGVEVLSFDDAPGCFVSTFGKLWVAWLCVSSHVCVCGSGMFLPDAGLAVHTVYHRSSGYSGQSLGHRRVRYGWPVSLRRSCVVLRDDTVGTSNFAVDFAQTSMQCDMHVHRHRQTGSISAIGFLLSDEHGPINPISPTTLSVAWDVSNGRVSGKTVSLLFWAH